MCNMMIKKWINLVIKFLRILLIYRHKKMTESFERKVCTFHSIFVINNKKY